MGKGVGREKNVMHSVVSLDRNLEPLRQEVSVCIKCPLHQGRRQTVFGEGSPSAKLMFVGEAPGSEEDQQGRPFVGQAGKLLTKIIEAIGLKREDVYIANIIKCRPPGNRAPLPEEIHSCEPYLVRQIEFIRPRLICALGKYAAMVLVRKEESISLLRGNFYDYQGIPVMPTFHPAYLLRNPSAKRLVWEDMKKLKTTLEKLETSP
ncbi:MAG: uracil-DNA glycosylase [Candidatus Omnitrophica bacterium]|nr:uracil-DNA glycosylase [Candidatus Omnitrophota bacterium]